MVNFDGLYSKTYGISAHFAVNNFVDKKLGFQVIERGTMLPHKRTIEGQIPRSSWGYGGIVDSQGTSIKSSFVHYDAGDPYTPPPESIQHRSETVIYLGMFSSTWGHAITDNISRLWFLKSEFMKQFKNCPIVYLIHAGNNKPYTLQKDFIRLLEILEVDVNKIQEIAQPTQFDKIILPDESFYLEGFHRFFTKEYQEAIDHVRDFALKNRTPISNKKLYFYHGMRQVGEERLAEYFKSKGYEIITHEQRANFDEELNLLINCEHFATSLGSIAHNSLFLRDSTETIFIPRAFSAFTGYQHAVDQVHPINANYIDSTFSIFSTRMNCYIISEQLKKFFGDKWNGYDEEDFKIFLQYLKECLNNVFQPNARQVECYGSVLQDFVAQLKRRKDLIASYDMPYGWDTFRSQLTYNTYVRVKAWRDGWKGENQLSNPLDQELEVLAFQINYPSHKVYSSVYYNEEEGWTKEVPLRTWAGMIGQYKPIYGMRIRLDEAGAKEFNILYRMHKFDGTWTPWAKNGEALYSHGQKLNAIQIKLEPVNKLEPVKIQPDKTKTEEFNYQTFLSKSDEIYLQGQRPQMGR